MVKMFAQFGLVHSFQACCALAHVRVRFRQWRRRVGKQRFARRFLGQERRLVLRRLALQSNRGEAREELGG